MDSGEELSGALTGRAGAMAERLAATARRMGMGEEDAEAVVHAFRLAMRPRIERLEDEHHPDFLHPARIAMILMDDAGVNAPEVVAAGILTETRDPGLAVELQALEEGAGAAAELSAITLELLRRLPTPAVEGERLLEALLESPLTVRLIALAERLDHSRHLHLRGEEEWAPYHALSCEVYAPLAAVTDPTFDRRYRWWCRTFQRRFLVRGPAARG